MRLFTKLRAEEIKTIAYLSPVVPPQTDVPVIRDGEAQSDFDVRLAAWKKQQESKSDFASDTTDEDRVVVTDLHGGSYEMAKADLLLSPVVAERKDPAGPQVGDWYVVDYDILTDKPIRKVYDAKTFLQYFKASLSG